MKLDYQKVLLDNQKNKDDQEARSPKKKSKISQRKLVSRTSTTLKKKGLKPAKNKIDYVFLGCHFNSHNIVTFISQEERAKKTTKDTKKQCSMKK